LSGHGLWWLAATLARAAAPLRWSPLRRTTRSNMPSSFSASAEILSWREALASVF